MDYSRCLSRLQKLCSKAEYCRADVYRKALKDLEGDADAASRVAASLVADKYVDDFRYASAFAREKSSIQGWGPVKIRYQLRAKGVPEACIAAALEEIADSPAAASRLEKLLEAKKKMLEGDPQAKLKLIKFALSRGYEYEEVTSCLQLLLRGTCQD